MDEFYVLSPEERQKVDEILRDSEEEARRLVARLEADESAAAAYDVLDNQLSALEELGITREELLSEEQAMAFRGLTRSARTWVRAAICSDAEARERISAATQGGIGAATSAVVALFVTGVAAIPIAFGVGIVSSVVAVIVYREGTDALCDEKSDVA